ncbi:DUF362 domain-containing protein [Candidatus Woesearchaeota archaeon]|nr:DUF362 domain-containing protein [Candidatus Woesearchaeota archaeon]
MPYTVSLEKCSSYSQEEVDKSVGKLINNLGGIQKFVKKGQKVLLKPNIVKGALPEESMTTHPAVIESIVKILKENKCEVLVGDSPFSDDTIGAMKTCGIYDVCRRHNAEIAVFNKRVNVKNDNGLVVKEFPLTHYFNEVDCIINIPKLKTHSQLYFTGAVKNLYSMMPGPRRGFYHLKYSNMEYFANMLLDLYALLKEKVVLNIIDGVYGMEGNGPCNGSAKFAGILAASSDANALDLVSCGLTGLDSNNLPTLHYARKRKDYLLDEKNVKIIGEGIKNIKIEPFQEAEYSTLNMMPKFVNSFKDYIMRHKEELVY